MTHSSDYSRKIVHDYCVLDTETTGLSAYYDEIIEVGILKIRDNEIVDTYSQLIKPSEEISDFITRLTGISNDMMQDMPTIADIKDSILEFIGDDVIIGHNISFDIRFLNAGLDYELDNHCVDTRQLSRKLFTDLKHHRLSDLTKYFNLYNNEHRALADCIATKQLYDVIKNAMREKDLQINDLFSKKHYHNISIKDIKPTVDDIDQNNFFFDKHIVFTGKLEKYTRKEVMQMVVNLGGILDNSVAAKTNLLVLGNNDYHKSLKNKKSSKHLSAENLKLNGHDIDIIDEFTFYDLLDLLNKQ